MVLKLQLRSFSFSSLLAKHRIHSHVCEEFLGNIHTLTFDYLESAANTLSTKFLQNFQVANYSTHYWLFTSTFQDTNENKTSSFIIRVINSATAYPNARCTVVRCVVLSTHIGSTGYPPIIDCLMWNRFICLNRKLNSTFMMVVNRIRN